MLRVLQSRGHLTVSLVNDPPSLFHRSGIDDLFQKLEGSLAPTGGTPSVLVHRLSQYALSVADGHQRWAARRRATVQLAAVHRRFPAARRV